MKKIIALLIILAAVQLLKAQSAKPELVTDRPDQTEAPVLVPTGGLQVETGFVYEKDRSEGTQTANIAYNTTLIKYGVNEFVELRFISEYLGQKIKYPENQNTQIKGMSPLALGVKIKLAEEKGFWPQAAFIGHINLRNGSEEFRPSYTAADFRFTFAHTLSDRLALSYNLGAEWDGETPEAAFLYTFSLGYVFTERLGVFVETYSFFPEDNKADHRFDAGLTYKFTPVIQWDISGGFGLSENAPDSFISTGISFRLFK
ncbi:MAG: transporter [Cyclobacteriaceae bacterium]|nr:transporter [Cyclobacteriaceae bacterium]